MLFGIRIVLFGFLIFKSDTELRYQNKISELGVYLNLVRGFHIIVFLSTKIVSIGFSFRFNLRNSEFSIYFMKLLLHVIHSLYKNTYYFIHGRMS